MSQRKRIQREFATDPALYDRAMSTGLMKWMLAGRREKVGEKVRGRVLDVGYGTGLSLPHYPQSAEVVGIDLSLPMLQHSPRATARVQADAEQLPFPDQSFDSVAFNLCLCTIPDPERALREALRVIRPGGPIVLLEHVRSNVLPVALVQDAINPVCVWLQADHFNRRTADTARRAGVEIVRIERWFLGIFNLIVGRAPVDRP